MKNISVTSGTVISNAGLCPSEVAVSHLRHRTQAAAARPAAATYVRAASGSRSGFGKLADKQAGMVRINATGWPLGPRDRLSG